MNTSLHAILPEPLSERIRAWALDEGTSPDQFIITALEEKLTMLEVGRRMRECVDRGDMEEFRRILAQAPDVEPEEYDRLSPELAARLDEKFGKVR